MTRIGKPPHGSLRATAALAAALLACAAAWSAPAPIPLFDATAIEQRCTREIHATRRRIERLARTRDPLLAAFNRHSLAAARFENPVYLLANVAPDQATRDAAQACVDRFAPLRTELFQNQALLRRLRALAPGDAVDRSYRQDLLDGFEDSGASLPPPQRARAKAIAAELEVLGLAFQKAINEDPTKVVLTPDEAEGLGPSWLAARERDAEGRLVLGLDEPTLIPFLQNATREPARRRAWTAFQNQGGPANLERLDRALQLRHELAQLHGAPDYASFVLRRRMASTPQAVQEFLDRVHNAVVDSEQRELAELRAEKAAASGPDSDAVALQRWDVAYLQERIRRARYAIDQEQLRAFFPTDASVRFAIKVAERLYGIAFVPAVVPVWHTQVRHYEVRERGAGGRPGALLGNVYLDLLPRAGKYSSAAAFQVVPGSRLAGQKPAAVLVGNFDPVGLNHGELEILLHEFGHVLHGVLSKARYADQSGTSVKNDFVEAPSQMFEEWARRPQTLALLAEVCPDCPRLSPAQLERLDAARRFGRGLRYSRQWQYARYDMQLHQGPPRPALQTWIALERSMALGYVDGTMLPAGFGHLMGSYAAGYYGYLWSEVLALDMLSAFDGRLMDARVGRRYRELILAPGGERPPQELVERFLGRQPSADAFFAEIAGRR